jgi:hypothetical protein
MYGDIQKTFDSMITTKSELLEKLHYAINNEICIPWLAIDDVAALFPKSMYFTNRVAYSALQAAWETTRTAFNCIEYTCVIKSKVASFLLEDLTGDITCYNPVFTEGGYPVKGTYEYKRWMWLPNFKDPTKNIAKTIIVETIPFPVTPDAFTYDKELRTREFICGGQIYIGREFYEKRACLLGVKTEDFKVYWERRLALTKTAYEVFADILDKMVSSGSNRSNKEKREEEEKAPLTKEELSAIRAEAGRKGAQVTNAKCPIRKYQPTPQESEEE